MTCRCSNAAEHAARAAEQAAYSDRTGAERLARRVAELEAALAATTPDPTKYEILDVHELPGYLVVKARFPSCKKCAFEGTKILVYANVKPVDAMKWRSLDPHFREVRPRPPTEAPSPIARFPGSDLGWEQALAFTAQAQKNNK